MPLQMRGIFSSHIERGGFEPETGELHIEWQNGKHSVYKNVPADKANMVLNSASVGQALHEHIKNNPDHEHEYL